MESWSANPKQNLSRYIQRSTEELGKRVGMIAEIVALAPSDTLENYLRFILEKTASRHKMVTIADFYELLRIIFANHLDPEFVDYIEVGGHPQEIVEGKLRLCQAVIEDFVRERKLVGVADMWQLDFRLRPRTASTPTLVTSASIDDLFEPPA